MLQQQDHRLRVQRLASDVYSRAGAVRACSIASTDGDAWLAGSAVGKAAAASEGSR